MHQPDPPLRESIRAVALSAPRKARLGQRVAMILRRYLAHTDLQAGELLPSERDLSRRLGVSHRVVREALAELVEDGLIKKEHGKGAFVQPFDRADLARRLAGEVFGDLSELLEARTALECGIMPLVVQRVTDEDLAVLEEILERERKRYRQGESPAAEDVEFHLTLLRLAGNRVLMRFGSLITDSLRANIYRTPELMDTSYPDDFFAMDTHAEILVALRARDTDRAINAISRQLQLKERQASG